MHVPGGQNDITWQREKKVTGNLGCLIDILSTYSSACASTEAIVPKQFLTQMLCG